MNKAAKAHLRGAGITTELGDRDLVGQYIDRIVVKPTVIEILLARNIGASEPISEVPSNDQCEEGNNKLLLVGWRAPTFAMAKGVTRAPADNATLKPETRDTILTAIAKARIWVENLVDGRTSSFAQIAESEGIGERQVRLLAALAFVPPNTLLSIIEGSAQSALTVTGLARNVPFVWTADRRLPSETVSDNC